jgi:hypothetical protein
MLVILPLLTFVLASLDLLGLQTRRGDRFGGVRLVLLEAATFLGGYMLVFSEILSLFRLLTGPWAAVCWGLALALTVWLGWKKGLLVDGLRDLRARRPRLDWFDWTAGAILAVILVLLFLTAVISPSNNNDSLHYHMSRVMHWAEDQSLGYYATAYDVQLYSPIWAETTILNLRLLWGNDQLANLVQWSSLIFSLIGASLLAKYLGAGRKGQWAAAAFTAGLPMALLEATSTQNDLVTAFWLISLLSFVVIATKRELFWEEFIGLAVAIGLGLLTKATFFPYAIAPMLYFIVIQFKRNKLGKVVFRGLIIGLIVLTLNTGYWGRNLAVYGGLLGPTSVYKGEKVNLFEPSSIPGSVIRVTLLNLAVPEDSLNDVAIHYLTEAFDAIGLHMLDGFTPQWGWNHEDLASNPIQMLLIPATLLILLLTRRRIDTHLIVPYLLVTISLYFLLPIVKNIADVERRYQLPFFVAWGPIFGIAFASSSRKWLAPTSIILLLVAAFPWVLFNRTRPLIAMRPSSDPFTIPCLAGCTAGSILNEPPVRVLFAGWIDLQGPYTDATSAIRQSSCRSVGLQLDSHDIEYAFWWLLDAPQSGIRLETIFASPQLERFIDPSFKPCAILCTICRGKARLHGLDLVSDFTGKVQLYAGSNYDPDANK